MSLRREFETSGNWLFRRRSFLPISLAVPMLIALYQFGSSQHAKPLSEYWELLCLGVSCAGLGIRILTVGFVPVNTSGRSTRRQTADTLNTTGCYATVRHPIYFGNLLIWLGLVTFPGVWWFVFVFILAYWLYYERIMFAEEQFLERQFGERFNDWAARTPAFVPNPLKWRRPSMPFSVRTVLRREYTSFFAIAVGFGVLDVIEDSIVADALDVEAFGLTLVTLGTVAYLTLRIVKKRTRLLNVEGR